MTTPDPRGGPGAVSAAPFGSASILPISWMYITMMGDDLRRATEVAILSANYVARRLSEHYPVLYTGRDGLVAHECIIDLRPIEKATGVTNEDVAKRLIDYGFHAPTMSFPVAGTLMIEPTESESLAELDRFCEAMISIRAEIAAVGDGVWPADDNPLCNAPHTALEVGDDDWDHPYPRSLAGWPSDHQREAKYWAPVSRIDGGYGDRNLVCSCPPIEDLARVARTGGAAQGRATKGSSTHRAGTKVPRMSTATSSPTPTPGSTYASAMPHSSTGEKLPELTLPTVRPSATTG